MELIIVQKRPPTSRGENDWGEDIDISGISAVPYGTVMNLWENLCGDKRFSS
jgi:hypothetical protein